MNLSRYERGMQGAAWCAYMAGHSASERDRWINDARRTRDSDLRKMYVRFARRLHHAYLKNAGAAQPMASVSQLTDDVCRSR